MPYSALVALHAPFVGAALAFYIYQRFTVMSEYNHNTFRVLALVLAACAVFTLFAEGGPRQLYYTGNHAIYTILLAAVVCGIVAGGMFLANHLDRLSTTFTKE